MDIYRVYEINTNRPLKEYTIPTSYDEAWDQADKDGFNKYKHKICKITKLTKKEIGF